MEKNLITTKEQLDELYNHSALTFEGVAETEENFNFLENWLNEHKALKGELEVDIIKGKTMNEIYGLTGDNAYPNDLTILSVHPTCINLGKIAIPRFELGGRWFDDVVDNNLMREGR